MDTRKGIAQELMYNTAADGRVNNVDHKWDNNRQRADRQMQLGVEWSCRTTIDNNEIIVNVRTEWNGCEFMLHSSVWMMKCFVFVLLTYIQAPRPNIQIRRCPPAYSLLN